MLSDFHKTIREGLKEKSCTVLFQMPPRVNDTEQHLEKIISSLDPSFTNVVEFRHESWWNNDVYNNLATNKIIFGGMIHPDLPREIIQNPRVCIIVCMGSPIYTRLLINFPPLKK